MYYLSCFSVSIIAAHDQLGAEGGLGRTSGFTDCHINAGGMPVDRKLYETYQLSLSFSKSAELLLSRIPLIYLSISLCSIVVSLSFSLYIVPYGASCSRTASSLLEYNSL
jgi:hypothetical protein